MVSLRHWIAVLLGIAGALTWTTGAAVAADPPVISLARGGSPQLSIVVGPSASDRERELAATLAEYLGRIAGARFEVTAGDGTTGLAVGTAKRFPAVSLQRELSGEGFAADEQYVLRSHPQGMYIVGRTEVATEHAVWDLLYRLGYRQFFPGPTWEVVPRVPDLKLAVDARERPDYAFRSIWYGFGVWDYNAEPYRQWLVRNRMAGSFQLRSGHAYDGILHKCKAEFQAHPEYLGLVGGKRTSSKFCTSNPGLRRLVVRYAMDWLAANPDEQCVSIDPSDGGGWCECEPCRAMGTPSDRALTLANEISAELEAKHPGKYVAMYAYAQHSPPPAIRARPRVIVNCATAFIRGGLSIDAIIAGWKERGVQQFGIREYYSVHTWDRDLPGRARGAQPEYLARSIPKFHSLGAKFLSAESSDNWGPNGLGYYLASRMLWDVREAAHTPALRDDFLLRAFGPAKQPMAEFYQILNGSEPPLMSRHLLGRMYRLLGQAASSGPDPGVRARLDDLVLYTRYVELFQQYQNAAGEKRQAAFEQLIRHGYRIRRTMMVHTKALYRDLAARDKAVRVPADAAWNVPEPKNRWKSTAPWTRQELDHLVEQGVSSNPLRSFEPVTFGRDLVPQDEAQLPNVPWLDDAQAGRHTQTYYTWFPQAPAALPLKITGGLIAHYRDRGNVRLELFSVAGDQERLVGQDASVPPDGKPRDVVLRSDRTGLHKLVVSDGGDRTEVQWPKGRARTIELRGDAELAGRRSGYFYVPRGTRVVGGFATNTSGQVIKDSRSLAVYRFADLDGPGYFQVPVPPGQDGTFWRFEGIAGQLALLTVPPYAARHPQELLLPKEVAIQATKPR